MDWSVWYTLAHDAFEHPLMKVDFHGNSVKRYLAALVLFLVCWGLVFLFRTVILERYRRYFDKPGTRRRSFYKAIRRVTPVTLFFVALYPALKIIRVPGTLDKAFDAILTIFIVFEATRFAQMLVEISMRRTASRDQTMLNAIKLAVAIVVWAIGILLVLSNLGYNVGTLAASLGIGGIAVAFAARGILEDLFASYSIYFDRPFQIGDTITIGADSGTVQYIGLKTTRLQSTAGHELVISNKELTNVRVNNNSRLKRRRVVIRFGVDYETPPEKLEAIPTLVKELIAGHEATEFDHAHLVQFGDWGVIYEVVYFVTTADNPLHLDIQQAVLLGIMKAMREHRISMTINGQSLYFLREKADFEKQFEAADQPA